MHTRQQPAGPTPTFTPAAPVAAVVNGEFIYLADLELGVARYESALIDAGLDPESEEGQIQLAGLRTEVLDSLIDSLLIDQAAREMGLTVDDATLEAQIQSDIEAGGGQVAFDEWLLMTGQSREEYESAVRQSLVAQRVLDWVAQGVPEEVEQVHLRDALLDTEEAARDVIREIQGGADFAALARERSLDRQTGAEGGDLGWMPRGVLAVEMEDPAFALKPGQISDVIQVGDGYHVIQVIERESARRLAPDVRMNLELAQFAEWLAERRAKADVEQLSAP
jgi:parvulin-like peptidyl-prolyl isomerase